MNGQNSDASTPVVNESGADDVIDVVTDDPASIPLVDLTPRPRKGEPSSDAGPRAATTSDADADAGTNLDVAADAVPSADARRRRFRPDRDAWLDRLDRLYTAVAWPPSPGQVFGLVYMLCAVIITRNLLKDPSHKVLAGNPYDQYYFEWQLGWVQHALFHFQNPLFSHAMNAPTGFNVQANPQILGPAALLSPITWLLGAPVSFALLMAFNFAATAVTWRWFLLRNGIASQTAAFVGGLFMGFAPSMVTHSLAHPDLASQWLIPVIVDRVLRLRSREDVMRNGIVLGFLIAAQLFIGEELLFLAAVGLTLFIGAYVAMRPSVLLRDGLPFLKGSAIAGALAAVLLVYPLTFQFKGNQSFTGIPFDIRWYSADLKSYLLIPSLDLWGDPHVLSPLAAGNTEQAAFLGGGFVILMLTMFAWCVRSLVVRAMFPAVAVLVLLSLGPTPKYLGKPLPSPFGPSGLWNVIGKWPLFSSGLPIRMAMAASWFIGILLAIAVERAVTHRWLAVRGVAVFALVVTLVPLTPRIFETYDRPTIPAFITDGAWKTCVSPGHRTIVTVPPSDAGDRTAMVWQTAADLGFDIPQGSVFVPVSATDRLVHFGLINITWTASWLTWIHANGGGATPPVDDVIRAQVRADLGKLGANCVVANAQDPNLAAEKVFLDGAMAPGGYLDGVWVWREPQS